MEGAPKEDSEKVAFDEPVFLSGKDTGKAQGGKGEKVITAYLERGQYVGAAALKKLQDAVGEGYGETGA